ncbi:MAG: hypothetical protein H6Q02_2416 [Acidobacteria bacterium]|nr:hypothetical protein [Acidobacteriota bacterium]
MKDRVPAAWPEAPTQAAIVASGIRWPRIDSSSWSSGGPAPHAMPPSTSPVPSPIRNRVGPRASREPLMVASASSWSSSMGGSSSGRASTRAPTTRLCHGPLRVTTRSPWPAIHGGSTSLPTKALTTDATSPRAAGDTLSDQSGCQLPTVSGPCHSTIDAPIWRSSEAKRSSPSDVFSSATVPRIGRPLPSGRSSAVNRPWLRSMARPSHASSPSTCARAARPPRGTLRWPRNRVSDRPSSDSCARCGRVGPRSWSR